METNNDGFRVPESDHQLKQLISVPTIGMEDRKLKSQQATLIHCEAGNMRQPKESNRRTVPII